MTNFITQTDSRLTFKTEGSFKLRWLKYDYFFKFFFRYFTSWIISVIHLLSQMDKQELIPSNLSELCCSQACFMSCNSL